MDREYEDFKERVRSSANIVEVISPYVSLQRKGSRYWGCCPFHGEKTPSFAVSAERQMFYCFGCHLGGDVFKFIMEKEHCGFADALKILAARYNIPIPEKAKTQEEIQREVRARAVIAANELASKYFQACLSKSSYGKEALAYLSDRGIGQKIISDFSIGYALLGQDALIRNLAKRGVDTAVLLEAGLAVKQKDGTHCDKFRDRVMIPIKNPRGQIVGFGGRILQNNKMTAKYMNTAETEFFNKRRLLFALDVAGKNIREKKQAIIVEGYMDAISLYSVGINNVVASMGTAFSEQQAKLLRRYNCEVVFCYDSDAAGRNAAFTAVSVARRYGLTARVASVPEGKDPDEFIRSRGQSGSNDFLQLIVGAQHGLDYQLSELIKQINVTNLAGKQKVVAKYIPLLLESNNRIEVSKYITELSARLTLTEDLIMNEYRNALRNAGLQNNVSEKALSSGANQNPDKEAPDGLIAEKTIFALLLQDVTRLNLCRESFEEIGFSCNSMREIFLTLQAYDPSSALSPAQYLSDCYADNAELLRSVAEIAALDVMSTAPRANSAHTIQVSMESQADESASSVEKIIAGCLKQLKEYHLQEQYLLHSRQANEYLQSGDSRFRDELAEAERLQSEIKKLHLD